MQISGTFKNISNETIEVIFWNNENMTVNIEIGEHETSDVLFAGEPVVISSNCDDSFQELIIKNCTVNLLTKNHLKEYLYSELGQVKVNIYNRTKNQVLFIGFVEPEIYSQPYAYDYEPLTINCIDCLGMLQYLNYGGKDYNSARQQAVLKPFVDIIDEIVASFKNMMLNIDSLDDVNWLYICRNGNNLCADLNNRISEIIFYGENIDNVVKLDEAFKWILRYFNLRAIQEGDYVYLFDKQDFMFNPNDYNKYSYTPQQIRNLSSGNSQGLTRVINVNSSDIADDNTNISTSEVYNQIIITCPRTALDNLFESPLEQKLLTSPYSNKQYFMLQTAGSGYDADDKTNFTHWFFRYKESPNWKFNYLDYNNNLAVLKPVTDFVSYDSNNNACKQWKILTEMNTRPFVSSILSLGNFKVEYDDTTNGKDILNYWNVNKCVGYPSMTDKLIISVNGCDDEQKLADIMGLSADNENIDTLNNNRGLIEYKSNVNMVFSPSDDKITNYIVFSGNIMYVPILEERRVTSIPGLNSYSDDGYVMDDDKVDRFIGVKREYPNSDDVVNFFGDFPRTDMILPPADNMPKSLQYLYNENNAQVDMIDRIPVLQCVLKIGDKYLHWGELEKTGYYYQNGEIVEYTYTEEGYEWRTDFSTFNLSINPAIDDYIIGQKYELLNDVSIMTGLEEKGMAIPIKSSDHLAGKIEFYILGPYNSIFEQVTKKVKRKFIFWKKTTYTNEDIPLLSKTKYIEITDFECKFVTDNGKIDLLNDADLMYYSDENLNYLNKKDDIEFNINSAISLEESQESGVNNYVCVNNPIKSDNTPVINLSTGVKAEHKYIDALYNEYNKPRLIVDTKLKNASNFIPVHLKTMDFNAHGIGNCSVITSEYDVYNNTLNIKTKSL